MIGQSGIGKTTFLEKFPNSVKHTKSEESLKYGLAKEIFSIETLNPKFEKIAIDVENCDITLETCLNDSDLIVNNKVIPSNQFINTCNFRIIILCFALDDPSSFELVKLKWEIDLKRNKMKNHSYVLLGLKSDTQSPKTGHKQDNITALKNRSCSVNSNSSTSKLQVKASKNDKRVCVNEDVEFNNQFSTSEYKKFAKSIGSINFIQYSSETDGNQVVSSSKKSKDSLNSYEKLLKNILAKQNSPIPVIKSSTNNSNLNSNKNSRIPKSLSAPINLLVSRKSRKLEPNLELNEFQHDHPNAEENATAKKLIEIQSKSKETISIKSKLSRLAIGLGTYIVTCGSAQSRKLADMKQLRDTNQTENKQSKKLIKKNKSWLLLASEISLNTLDNDEVFS